MIILIDLGYIYDESSFCVGVVKYALKILDSIVEAKTCEKFILIVNKKIAYYFDDKYPEFKKEIIQLSDYRATNNYWIRQIKKSFSIFSDFIQYKKIKNHYDYVFCPFANYAGLSFNRLKNQIITMHDFYYLNKWNKNSLRYKLTYNQTKRRLQKAKTIVTTSNYTVSELRKYFPTIKTEVEVVPIIVRYNNLGDLEFNTENKKPYFFWVNAIAPHKNILTMIKAFYDGCFYNDYDLVIVGKKNNYWLNTVEPYINSLDLMSNIFVFENITEELLQALYKNAYLFITTSMNEGFGLTPLEAALNSIPVISTKCQSLPEVTLNLLNYYEPPLSADSLRKSISDIIVNYPSQEKLTEIKSKIISEYSSQRLYTLFIQLFEK